MNNEQFIRVDVQFRHMPKSAAIERLVKVEVVELERFAFPGSHCEVVIDETQHRHLGGVFSVRAQLVIPGDGHYVAHRNALNGSHEFIYGAVSETFEELQAQLRKRSRQQLRRQRREMAA